MRAPFSFLGGAAVPIFSTDFTVPAAGDMSAATFLSTYGLTFARASDGFTVQDTPSTLISGLTGNNRPRFANGAGGTLGLVLEDARTNMWLRSNDSQAGGAGGSLVVRTTSYATGPDGVALADRLQVSSGGYAGYFPNGVVSHGMASFWIRQATAGGVYLATESDGATLAFATGSTVSSWKKVSTPFYSGASWNFCPSNGADNTSLGGGGPAPRDGVFAWLQIEGSQYGSGDGARYATEAITAFNPGNLTDVTRAAERLYHATGASMVSSGRLSLELKFVLKAASLSDYQYVTATATVQLWYVDANNQAYFTASTKILTVIVGGTSQSFAGAISVAGTFEMFLCAGGGLATTLAYRTNGGAVTRPASPGTLGTLTVAGALDIMCKGTTNTFAAWVHHVNAYRSGSAPSWA